MRRKIKVPLAPLCAFAAVLASGPLARATLAPHAPSLSVHESCYGTVTLGDRRESIQGLEIRIASHSDPEKTYQVQCFFLKRGAQGGSPTVDDTVIFDVVNPHGTYEVLANPIKLTGAAKQTQAKSSKTLNAAKPTAKDYPREGFVVRILGSDDAVLREFFSTHPIERLVREHPEILNKAANKKSARHPVAVNLLKGRPRPMEAT